MLAEELFGKCRIKHHTFATQDLYTGLVWFCREYGRLPATEAEFVSQPYVVPGRDGLVRVQQSGAASDLPVYGEPFNLSGYHVPWGSTVDEYDRVIDTNGKVVEAMTPPADPASAHDYTAAIVREIQDRPGVLTPTFPAPVFTGAPLT